MTTNPALRARDLSFSFSTIPVLRGIDVELPWGTLTAIAGSNGAGKSTLVELLAGVRTPQSGTVERADEVALVVQRPMVLDSLPLTVREVVSMGTWSARWSGAPRLRKGQRQARVADALERVHLSDLAGRSFSALSGGQRQRVLLAQGIARQARIFLLDEPAAGLDAESRARTRAMLVAEAARGAAVACVTHDDESIEAADLVVRLESGKRVS